MNKKRTLNSERFLTENKNKKKLIVERSCCFHFMAT